MALVLSVMVLELVLVLTIWGLLVRKPSCTLISVCWPVVTASLKMQSCSASVAPSVQVLTCFVTALFSSGFYAGVGITVMYSKDILRWGCFVFSIIQYVHSKLPAIQKNLSGWQKCNSLVTSYSSCSISISIRCNLHNNNDPELTWQIIRSAPTCHKFHQH